MLPAPQRPMLQLLRAAMIQELVNKNQELLSSGSFRASKGKGKGGKLVKEPAKGVRAAGSGPLEGLDCTACLP